MHLFNRALELLANPPLKSKQELLELVKKAKHDANKYHPLAPTIVKKPSHKYYCFSLLSFSLLFLEFFGVFWTFCGEKIVHYKAFGFSIKCVMFVCFLHRSRSCGSHRLSIFRTLIEPWGSSCQSCKSIVFLG